MRFNSLHVNPKLQIKVVLQTVSYTRSMQNW